MRESKYSVPFRKSQRFHICEAPFHREAANMRHCVDFAVSEGTPVVAARDGVVVERESRYARAYGNKRYANRTNYVVLRHADGEETLYVHLRRHSVRVRVGQLVRRGQIIALSGQTGYATYPHLHFGAYDRRGRNIPINF